MFYFDQNYGLFVGKLTDNRFHKHYALQISVSKKLELNLCVKNKMERVGNLFLLNSNIEHKLICDAIQLTILVNPLSVIGYKLSLELNNSDYLVLNNDLSNKLTSCIFKFQNNELTFENLCSLIGSIMVEYNYFSDKEIHFQDTRILKALEYMDEHFEKVLSLEELAEHCHLSPTRFLHLFKEKTKLTFRRYQLWNKIVKSLSYLTKNSITKTAYKFGFSDSSHYTRTFIETFGVTPKFFFTKN